MVVSKVNMDNFRKLEEIFGHFPGIGPRQAKRFVYYILSRSNSTISEFVRLINETKKDSSECEKCHRLFIAQNSEGLCNICRDKSRDNSILMVVARDSDFETIEKSSVYRGLYFILGGTVPILDDEPEKRIRLEKLLQYVANNKDLKEIILSLNTTREGVHTLDIIKDALCTIIDMNKIKITLLGRGLSSGAEIEYADSETIKYALKNRS